MAYTSDTRIKNILKDIHLEVLNELSKIGLENKLTLRVFDESSEDGRLFENGGLTFKDPNTKAILGSNDAGWLYNGKPLVIVEGTFGTERGQFGDGQLNRFSHSTGVALNGFIGVTFVPMHGESYSKSGTKQPNVNSNIKIKPAKIHKGFLTGAIAISEKEKGWFLVIDAYSPQVLCKLIIESVKDKEGLKNELQKNIDDIISVMKTKLGSSIYGARSIQLITSLFDCKGNKISSRSRMYTQNYVALTTSAKRDGHGMLGKNLVEIYSGPKNSDYYAIFIRLRKNEIKLLSQRNSKEFQYIFNHPKVNVKCFDDLKFNDSKLKKALEDIASVNIFQNRQNDIIKAIQTAFNNGEIQIN